MSKKSHPEKKKNVKAGHLKALFWILYKDLKFLSPLFENYKFHLNCLKVSHQPTNPPTTYPPTYVKVEDQVLNMFCIL